MRQISWQAAPALQLIKRPNALSCPHTQMPGPPRGVAPVEGAHVEGCQICVGQPWDLVADFPVGLHVRDKNVPIHLVDQHPVERPLCPSLGARCVHGVRGGVSCGTGGGSAVLLDAAEVLPVRRRRAGGRGGARRLCHSGCRLGSRCLFRRGQLPLLLMPRVLFRGANGPPPNTSLPPLAAWHCGAGSASSPRPAPRQVRYQHCYEPTHTLQGPVGPRREPARGRILNHY